MLKTRILAAAVACILLQPAYATTTRLSESSLGAEADSSSFSVKLSDDGRFAVFQTNATNLFPGDTNAVSDVLLKDMQTGALTCMSCGLGGIVGDGASSSPAISGDGRFVAFQSAATNLVAGDNNIATDVFVREIATGTLEIASRATGVAGAQGSATSGQARLSSTGQFVVFSSTATNLVTGDTNSQADAFVRDRLTSVTSRVSVATGGAQASGGVGGATASTISADGRFVVFTSGQQTLSSGDTNTLADAFLHDRQTTTTERLSTTQGTTGSCLDPTISADGSMLAFSSTFADLVAGDNNVVRDTFYRARTGTVLTRITAAGAVEANNTLEVPAFNGNGTKIAFQSAASNLVAGDSNAANDIFSLVIGTGVITRVSVSTAGLEANGSSTFPWYASASDIVAFSSGASNLIANDANASVDTFANRLSTVDPDAFLRDGFESP